MAECCDTGLFMSCLCLDYKAVIQQNYTYLEKRLDSKNGLVSHMFEKNVISFREKKSIEKIADVSERNREIIDLFLDEKTQDDYKLFLDCLRENGQAHIAKELQFGCTCSPSSKKSEVEIPKSSIKGDLEQVDKLILEDKLVVIGVCCMNGSIYCICHMDPHLYVHMGIQPFFRMKFQEFDLPVVKDQFHFYDMTCCSRDNVLTISDKANQCLWIVDVSRKSTSQVRVADGYPLRMSVSRYSSQCSDDEGYGDIYGENCASATSLSNESLDSSKLVQKLLVARLSELGNGRQSTAASDIPEAKPLGNSDKETILVVVKSSGQYCLRFYVNGLRPKFIQNISLLIDEQHIVSNAVQKYDDGHIFICYCQTDFGERSICFWYLGEYFPSGEMLRSYMSPNGIWIPRYLCFDDSDDESILAICRFSNEISKLKCQEDGTLKLSPMIVRRGEMSMPSRCSFFRPKPENGCNQFLLVGQGEIKKPRPSASVIIMKKLT